MVWTFDPDAFYENILSAWQLTKKQEVFKGTKKFKSEKLGTHLQSDEGFCVVLVLLVSVLIPNNMYQWSNNSVTFELDVRNLTFGIL